MDTIEKKFVLMELLTVLTWELIKIVIVIMNDAGQGVIRAEATFLTSSGDNFGCVWIRVAVDH